MAPFASLPLRRECICYGAICALATTLLVHLLCRLARTAISRLGTITIFQGILSLYCLWSCRSIIFWTQLQLSKRCLFLLLVQWSVS